jgi:hypothetical protein
MPDIWENPSILVTEGLNPQSARHENAIFYRSLWKKIEAKFTASCKSAADAALFYNRVKDAPSPPVELPEAADNIFGIMFKRWNPCQFSDLKIETKALVGILASHDGDQSNSVN